MIYQQAHEHDSNVHEKLREGNARRGLRPEKIFADMAYIKGEAICEYRKSGQELMGYIQGDSSKKPEAFKIHRFVIDMDRQKALCPAGRESLKGQIGKEGEIRMPFSQNACTICAFFRECVGEKRGKARILTVRPWYEFLRERRKAQETEMFRNEMRVRAQVEGTISEGTRFLGLRNAKYKGEEGHRIQFYMTGAALNVKRLIKAITQGVEIQTKPVPVFET